MGSHAKRSKINPGSTKNPTKILKNGILEGFWAVLGRFWATGSFPDTPKTPSKRLLGASWADFWSILPCLGGVLVRLREVLGGPLAVLERLGGVLDRLGGARARLS